MERTSNTSIVFFNQKAYNALIEKVSNVAKRGDPEATEDINLIKHATDSFHGYVQTIDMTETRVKIARYRCETEEFQEIAKEADRARRIAHEAAISNCAILNRVCKFYGIPENVYLGNTDARYQVANFCLEVTIALFQAARC